jgi:threonyl-tRNA synthetase
MQLDFTLASRFDLAVAHRDDGRLQPVIVHRAMLGSLERFIAILLEHTDGRLPAWLAPVQAVVLPVSVRHLAYAGDAAVALRSAGARAEPGGSDETLGARIRDAVRRRVPFVLVAGDREQEQGTVALREAGGAQRTIPLADAAHEIAAAVRPPAVNTAV